MKISALIEQLELMKAENGDVEVMAPMDFGNPDILPVASVRALVSLCEVSDGAVRQPANDTWPILVISTRSEP
jgi:hypothetical protein